MGHVLHFAWAPYEDGDVDAMKRHFGAAGFTRLTHRVPRAVRGKPQRLWRRIQASLGHQSAYTWTVDAWFDPALMPQLADLHRRHSFDAVFVEYVFMSKALEVFPLGVLKIVDTHDRFADRHKKYIAAGTRPEWFSTSVREESKGLARAQAVLAIQDAEAIEFSKHVESQVLTVGHLLDLSVRCKLSQLPRAVFVASGNAINVDAASYFIAGILPILRASIPDFELVLAGDVCLHVPDADGVLKLGRVNSVADAYKQGGVAINPVLMGSGLSIKTMECLALGIALVSTESGSRGLERWRGSAYLSVQDNNAEDMVEAIKAVLADETLKHRLGDEARRAAEEWNQLQISTLNGLLRFHEAR